MTSQTLLDRRTVLAATAGVLGASASPAAAAGGGSPRWLIVPDVEFFELGLVGQYVIVTDPTSKRVDESVMADCGFENWSVDEVRGYRGLLLDRLSDDPHAMEVPVYANAARADVVPGVPYVVTAIRDCGMWVAVRIEPIATETVGETALPPNATVGNRTPADGVEPEVADGNATGNRTDATGNRSAGTGAVRREAGDPARRGADDGGRASLVGAASAGVAAVAGWLRRD